MLSQRLLQVSKMIKKSAKVLDVGTDHAYLPIYLKKNKLCKSVCASDVSQNALDIAKKNLIKYDMDIKLYLSDGLENIKEDYDTITLCGMGTSTIVKILDGKKLPDNIIISSNNDLVKLRKYMNSIGYKIVDEQVVYENKKYYDIISYEKGKEKLNYKEVLLGKSNDIKYYKYLYNKEKEIFRKCRLSQKFKKIKNLLVLKKWSIEKKRGY